jgi:hypothetical protein
MMIRIVMIDMRHASPRFPYLTAAVTPLSFRRKLAYRG